MARFEVQEHDGKWYVVEINPKKGRLGCFWYRQPDRETAASKAAELNAALDARRSEQAARRAERSEARRRALAEGHGFRVGQLFSNSWGYDQTNIDFYEIVAVTRATVTLRPIAAHSVPKTQGFMSEARGPCPGKYTGPARRSPVQFRSWAGPGEDKFYIPAEFGCMSEVNPEDTLYCSWYA